MNIVPTIIMIMSITNIVTNTATKILLSLQLQSLSDSMVDTGWAVNKYNTFYVIKINIAIASYSHAISNRSESSLFPVNL